MAKLRNNLETAMTNGFDFGCPPIFLDEAKIFVWFCEKIVNGKLRKAKNAFKPSKKQMYLIFSRRSILRKANYFVPLHVEKCV